MSTRKIMCTIFWDRQGILFIEFLPRDMIINTAAYCETLNKLWHTIQNKRLGMLSEELCFCMTMCTHMPQLEHASCLLHSNGNWCITPLTDLHLFLDLKRFLAGNQFDSITR
jgi:hypothetical protein